MHRVHAGAASAVAVLDDDERDAHQHEHDGHDHRIIQMGVQPVIEHQTDDRCRDASHEDLEPQLKDIIPQKRAVLVSKVERKDLVPVKDDHGQDRAQLDHDQEHFPK